MKIQRFVARDQKILDLCRGKKVLHLGCVGFTDCTHQQKVSLAHQSLHAKLSEMTDCVGVDYDAATIKELQEAEVFDNVVYGNVEHLDKLNEDLGLFDVVLAGDIIEHLSNPGMMLEGVKSYLKPEGKFIVSTPNAFGIASYLRYAAGKFKEGAEHVLCFNPITLEQILSRHGYGVDMAESCYQEVAQNQYGVAFKLFRKMLKMFPKFGGTLIYVCSVRR